MELGVLAAIPAVAQAGTGIYQAVKGNRLANSMERPNFEIPQEILDNLTDSQMQALRGMPAEQKQQYIDNVMRSQQAALGAMGDRKAGLAGLGGVQQNAIDAYRNMLSMDAQQRQVNEQALQGVRSNVADYKDKQFQVNQLDPYNQTMQAAEAMKGAGIQNMMGGVTSGAQMGLDYGMFQQYMNMLKGSPASDPAKPIDITAETTTVLDSQPAYSTPTEGLTRSVEPNVYLNQGISPNTSAQMINELQQGQYPFANRGVYGAMRPINRFSNTGQ